MKADRPAGVSAPNEKVYLLGLGLNPRKPGGPPLSNHLVTSKIPLGPGNANPRSAPTVFLNHGLGHRGTKASRVHGWGAGVGWSGGQAFPGM
jgi:hypothetical protein